jgi:hypothetical protein
MAVLAARSHEGRIAAGDTLLDAATTLDTGRVKERLSRFAMALGAVEPAQKFVEGAALKRGARAAEDDGAKGLFSALFESTAAPKKPKKKPTAAPPAP